MRTAYKVRVYPIAEQVAVLNRTFGCVRLVWNTVLAWRQARYRAEGVTMPYAQTDRYLTELKRDGGHDFLYEVSSVPLQQALRHQHTAFVNFFAGRAKYPRFKSRRGRQSATYTRSAFRWRNGQLWLAKMDGPIAFVWSWPEVDPTTIDPTTVTVSRDSDGRWYASLAVETATEPEPAPATSSHTGIDLGVTHFAVLSTGEKIPNPRHLERKAKKLARYQRRMARKQRGSNNRAKARAKVARAHTKVREARADFLHRTSARLVRDHDLIVIEDLNVKGMIRNRSLARAISDCGWGEFRRQLEYKTQRCGRRLIVIDRWYPSSKICSVCGHLLATLSLSTRHWTCPDCGTRHDRDLNAAKNILAAGRAVSA
ncbi:IS200/IS605 family element transposase accessory protein TnpB [Microbispora bryophytorum]|uniref:Transposase n=1 Tax=Microbispora bryophytorum TaxID=1460882 RepID=A0A8H9GV63_9ACTN|nr:IS200/IS605 family element transposase accessory protein TnpB [Microbispora bryophytorum]TQS09652.1 IS200/IS605 family element transposase accessory protein TnpB [Microbispora bryophytorum]GGN97774.1 transposase [Microbispora bryophytorum]